MRSPGESAAMRSTICSGDWRGMGGRRLGRGGGPHGAWGGRGEAKVVVDLGDGAEGGGGAAAGGFLLDRDGGGETVDGVDVGALHLVEELARVGGGGFDVGGLAFGVGGVEGGGD